MRRLDDAKELSRAVVAVLSAPGSPGGTGFFAGKDGLILTAAHALAKRGAQPPDTIDVTVYANQTTRTNVTAAVVRRYFFDDRRTDIAILRIREAVPQWACYLEPGSSRWCDEQLQTFGFPKNEITGLGGFGVGHQLLAILPHLQFMSQQIKPGFSGGPLVNNQTRAVVAVTLSRHADVDHENFGVPIERVGAALANAWVARPADAEDDDTDALVVNWIEQISLRAGPRNAWEPPSWDTDPALTDETLQSLARTFRDCLTDELDGEVLWRLPTDALAAARSQVRAGGDWRQGVFAACRSSSSRLRLLAAILFEIENSAGKAFDDHVHRVLMLRHTEWAMREHAATLRPIGLAKALQFAAEAQVDAHDLEGGFEDRDRVLCLVRRLASSLDDALTRVMENAARWLRGELILPPRTALAQAGECSLVVVVRGDSGGEVEVVFFGIPHQVTPEDQKNLGNWTGKSLADPGFRRALRGAEELLLKTWPIPEERLTLEFALPKHLFAEEVEHLLYERTHEPLGTAYAVVLRSTERLYERQAYWADWKRKWKDFAANPVLHWLAVRDNTGPQRQRNAIRDASAVSLTFPHTVDLGDCHDPIQMCIEHMVPVALWRRCGGDSQAKGPQSREHVVGLRAWVRARRRAASAGEVDDSVVLLWDDPQRIPSDALEQRENLGRRAIP